MFWLEQFLYLSNFDIIVLALALAGFAVLAAFLKVNAKRHFIPQKVIILGAILFLLPIFVVLYAFFVEPNILTVKTYTFDTPKIDLEQPMKVIVIGDMQAKAHISPSYVKHTVDRVNALQPDYILWVGDLIENTSYDLPYFEPFQGFSAKYGKIAILGNHDYKELETNPIGDERAKKVEMALEEWGFTVLRNEAVATQYQDTRVGFGGTEDLWTKAYDFETTNTQVASNGAELNILLTHQPMTVEFNPNPELYALTVSGHCHGGQINLLFLNPLFGLPYLPEGCSKNPENAVGLFNEYNHNILVTPGVGSLEVRARLFRPPEITVVEIR